MAQNFGLGVGTVLGASLLYKLVKKEDDVVTISKVDWQNVERQLRDADREVNTVCEENKFLQQEIYLWQAKHAELARIIREKEKRTKEDQTIPTLQRSLASSNNEVTSLLQNAQLRQTIKSLTEKLTQTEKELQKETKQASGNLRMLTNERQQSKEVKQGLKKKCEEVTTQKDQLNKELTALRGTKLLMIQTALDDLSKRLQAISNRNNNSVRNSNHREFTKKFQTLKDDNDRMMRDLESVTFTTRLYQKDHDILLNIQERTNRRDSENLTKIREMTIDCKGLIDEYNSSMPERFLKAIAGFSRELDLVEKVNFNSEFKIEADLQEKILNGLLKERQMLTGILNVEKSNGPSDNLKAKKGNINESKIVNVLANTYALMIYNMPEANDHLLDIVAFETFMRQVTGRDIVCCGVTRFGAQKKKPRPAKITLKSSQDFEDVLKGKAVKEYSQIQVQKFVPREDKK